MQGRHIGTHEVAVRSLVRDEGGRERGWLRQAVRAIAQAVAGPARGCAEAGLAPDASMLEARRLIMSRLDGASRVNGAAHAISTISTRRGGL